MTIKKQLSQAQRDKLERRKAKAILSEKVFGGKVFYFETWAKKKPDAKKIAQALSNRGLLVRVVKDAFTGWWVVYGREK